MLLLALLVVAVFLVPLTDDGLPFGTLGFGMPLEFRYLFRSRWCLIRELLPTSRWPGLGCEHPSLLAQLFHFAGDLVKRLTC